MTRGIDVATGLGTLVDALARRTILVVGDVMLDEYIIGRPTRMSREAPVPVLELESKQYIAGGSANPATNIVSLGSRAIQVGVVGSDEAGEQLIDILVSRGIDASGVIACDDRPTTVKTRILAQMGLRFPQQVTRIDTVARHDIDIDTEAKIVAFVADNMEGVDAVLLSHYHGGLLTPSLVRQIRETCGQAGVLVTADVQGQFEQFAGIDVVKCNAADAGRFLNRALETDAEFAAAALQLKGSLDIKRAAIITRGSRGATFVCGDSIEHCPAPRVSDVFDTVGAGDTAIAVVTLALAAGSNLVDAVMLANHASGIVVQHLGNYAPTPPELAQSIALSTL